MDSLIIFGAEYLYFFSIATFVLYFSIQQKRMKRSIVVTSAIFFPAAYMMAKIGSFLYDNPRPFMTDAVIPLIPHAADNGFPSDHMLLVSAIAAILYMYNRKFGIVACVLAFFVGISRVYAGVHHWIDIAGSATIVVIIMVIIQGFILKNNETSEEGHDFQGVKF